MYTRLIPSLSNSFSESRWVSQSPRPYTQDPTDYRFGRERRYTSTTPSEPPYSRTGTGNPLPDSTVTDRSLYLSFVGTLGKDSSRGHSSYRG